MKDQCDHDNVPVGDAGSRDENIEAVIKAMMAIEAESPTQIKTPRQQSRSKQSSKRRLKASLKLPRYRPTVRQVALATGILVMVVKPWLLPILLVLVLAILLVSYWTLGHDRSVEVGVRAMEVFRKYCPELAARVEGRARNGLRRVNAMVEKLPEKWTEGLYLPDLEPAPDKPEKMQNDPFDRLTAD